MSVTCWRGGCDRYCRRMVKERVDRGLPLLQMVVAGFSTHTDLSKAQEIRNEVHRVTRNLKECQSLSQTYNQRERLFGMPVTQVGVLS